MNKTQILEVSTHVPAPRYTQAQICDQFVKFQNFSDRRARAISKIFDRAGVGFRHLVVPAEFFHVERTTEERNCLYMKEALLLGEVAIHHLLESTGYSPEDIDDLIVVSCTGLSIPGLDLQLAHRFQMRPNLRRTCILGMGCYGAFPALNRAAEAVQVNPERLTLVLCVELCSLHMQLEDSSENVVSSALFSDGAAAILLGNERSCEAHTPQIVGSATSCDYSTLEHMSFSLTDHGFRMYLSSYVPQLLGSQVKSFVDQFLAQYALTREQIRHWGIHPGSTKIVDYVQEELALTEQQVEASHHVLHEYGNMSSVTILFVLDHIRSHQQPASGDYGVLLAFGPGLTMEAILLRW